VISVLVTDDSNTYIYSENDARYPTIDKPIRPPGKSGSVGTLESFAKKNPLAGVGIVQPGTFHGWDNRFICDVSKALFTFKDYACYRALVTTWELTAT